jgi:endonuclease III
MRLPSSESLSSCGGITTKVLRFVCLAELLRNESIDDFHQLRTWLQNPACREKLRAIHGVGPKTVDYLCGLDGLDFIAVDRHIRAFARDAGVTAADYDRLQTVISYAADLLGVSRRHFDASIWTYVSNQKAGPQGRTTLQLPFDGSIAVA